MASVFPNGSYWTKSVALADNNKTTIYTCGDQGEEATDVTGISVSSTAAFADTVTLIRLQASDATEYTLIFKGPVGADDPLQIEGLPIHLTKGDAIKATATAGATHTLHVHISLNKQTRTPGAK